MNKRTTIFFVIILLTKISINGLCQNKPSLNQRKFQIENMVMATTTQGGFFPIFNNEFSLSYRFIDFFSAGLFYDYYHDSHELDKGKLVSNEHLPGIRVGISLISLKNYFTKHNVWPRFGIHIVSYLSYNTGGIHLSYTDKKDLQKWVNYYKLNLTYNIIQTFYLSTSVGLLNTNRIMLGGGIKF